MPWNRCSTTSCLSVSALALANLTDQTPPSALRPVNALL